MNTSMSPTETITFLCGVIMCVIGVSTFVSALITRARKDGQLEYKVDSALRGIDEIKDSLKGHGESQQRVKLKLEQHEEKLETLFRRTNELKESSEELRKFYEELLKERRD